MSADVDWSSAAEGGEGWAELASLERVEVYQATGMMMAQLDVDARAILLASITAGHPRWANPAYPRRGRGRENTR